MPLAPGARLGPYEITSAIGAGGMGEVYRARDTRLNRDVAIKMLPELFAADADRLGRFQREAQLLASLNHPHIAQIYGLEEADGSKALVLELVDGPTLADLISKGPLPADEVLPIARQICEALAAAHDHGIVHRDLKPANIKLTPDGTVKVLDFGLAKALDGSDAGRSVSSVRSETQEPALLSHSPTITSPAMTMGGVILGTAAYMSPEQAKGKPVDKRTDVWAFGCVLYEMLTGARAFDGEDVSDTLAVILRGEPDWNRLPSNVPLGLVTLMKRCLQKDRQQRVTDIAAARFVLNEPAFITPPVAAAHATTRPKANRERVVWAALFLTAATIAGYLALRAPTASEPLRRLSVAIPDGMVSHLALSPDGQRLVLSIAGEQAGQLWLRSLDSSDFRPMSGTLGARTPFWSPDSRSIGFFADGKLKVVPASGGPPVELCDGTGLGSGGTWNQDGVILFGTSVGAARALRRVNASDNRSCADVTNPTQAEHSFPEFLPDGEHFLYFVGGDSSTRGVHLASLANPSGRRLLSDVSSAIFSRASNSTRTGYLLFLRDGSLMAQPIDTKMLQPIGDIVPIVARASISASPPQVAASVSHDGLLVYLADNDRVSQLKWIDRGGKELGSAGAEGEQNGVALSPNEQFALLRRRGINGVTTTRLRDLNRDGDTQFSDRGGMGASSSVWSGDGLHVVQSDRGRLISRHVATGKDEEITPAGLSKYASDWSRDGRFLMYTEVHPKTLADIWILADPLNASRARNSTLYLATTSQESQAQLSPDGRWLAYASNESGGWAVYVNRFPAAGEKQRVSLGGGREPRWRRDGRELYYLAETGGRFRLMAVPVEVVANGLRMGTETALFDVRIFPFVPQSNIFQYSPASNGQRFLVNMMTTGAEPSLNVISNWQSVLQRE